SRFVHGHIKGSTWSLSPTGILQVRLNVLVQPVCWLNVITGLNEDVEPNGSEDVEPNGSRTLSPTGNILSPARCQQKIFPPIGGNQRGANSDDVLKRSDYGKRNRTKQKRRR
ncbi:MAG TPA: hypothetical protein PL040_08415, partial [Bacteroidales bacterium]|nr:hypothetical protein [Bacteroidales bacterium]